MPELPEVETMVRDLRARVSGATIESARIYWERTVGHPDVPGFEQGVAGRTIGRIDRIGKFALLRLDNESCLAVHRGMTGSMLLRPSGSQDDRFVRARFVLRDSRELRFDDARKFGRLYLRSAAETGWVPPWERLGPDPFGSNFTVDELAGRLIYRKAAIKGVLLNQAVVAGIGNIYADEILFRSRIHPLRPARSLNPNELHALHRATVAVLAAAIEQRGTTFSTYRDVDGEVGLNGGRLMVFHRDGEECLICGAEIRRIVVTARGTHYCPSCQPISG